MWLNSGDQPGGFYLLENPLKLFKALSLHGPRPNEKEDGKGSRVEDVDAPGVEEEDVPEVREARSAENAHKSLKREDFLDDQRVGLPLRSTS